MFVTCKPTCKMKSANIHENPINKHFLWHPQDSYFWNMTIKMIYNLAGKKSISHFVETEQNIRCIYFLTRLRLLCALHQWRTSVREFWLLLKQTSSLTNRLLQRCPESDEWSIKRQGEMWGEDSMGPTPRLTSRPANRSHFVLHTSGSGHLWNTLLSWGKHDGWHCHVTVNRSVSDTLQKRKAVSTIKTNWKCLCIWRSVTHLLSMAFNVNSDVRFGFSVPKYVRNDPSTVRMR